ncbi:hypothetical protein [Clostridium beijerinckii]|uniref:hypothetical protein n=1 Tax=Clostridium beijerinckii TaxID=1520 RepID=UPI0022E4965F|nr:hypothetical protein [Clostridium beijerinckii]
MKNRRLTINMIASILSFAINIGISFFLARFIVEKLGREAYGFIGLINNLISYASIVTIALNSLAGRFITLKIHQNDNESANIYFNSVFLGNVIMSFIIGIACIVMLINLNLLINIPYNLDVDVKVAFALVSIEFCTNLIFSVFGTATFVTDKLYLTSLRTIEANILKVIIIFFLFWAYLPKIFYVNISNISMSLFCILMNIYYTKKLLPQIKINLKYFDVKIIFELIKSGAWNIFTRISQILETGVDLLLTNMFLGPSSMGTLSITKTLPNAFVSFTGAIINVFAPQLTINYAKNEKENMLLVLRNSFRIMIAFTSIFFAFIVAYSEDFYKLWMPSQDAKTLYILTILSVFHMPITSGLNSLYNVFTVTNKLKKISIVLLAANTINFIIIIISCSFLPKEISILMVAGTSSLFSLLVMIFFAIPYSAKCLNLKKTIFLSDLIFCIIVNFVITLIFLFVKLFIDINSWIILFVVVMISGILGLMINIFFVIPREQRGMLFDKFVRRNK